MDKDTQSADQIYAPVKKSCERHTATFLIGDKPLNKTFRFTDSGECVLDKANQRAYLVVRKSFSIPDDDVDELCALLSAAAENPYCGLTLSTPTGDIPLDQPARRLSKVKDGHPPTLAEPRGGTTLFCLDIDHHHWPLDEPLDTFDPAPQIASAIDHIGMGDYSFVWQLSSSAKHGDRFLKCHIFFIMDNPLAFQVLKEAVGILGADKSVYHIAQLIYLASPTFIGGSDPIPQRWGVVHGEHELVPVQLIESIANKAKVKPQEDRYTENQSGIFYGGFDQILNYMGDGEGLLGFHEPLLKYIFLAVKQGYKPKRIKRDCREAIQKAPKSPERDASTIARYLSEEYLDESIDGAAKRLKNFYELPPMHPSAEKIATVPTAEAKITIKQVIASYFSNPTITNVLSATVGIGKTYMVVNQAIEWLANNPEGNIVLFAYTHEKAIELENFFNDLSPGTALRIKGRLHQDGNEAPLCGRHLVVEECKRAGLVKQTKIICCQNKKGGNSFECPLWNECRYYEQFKQKHRVRILQHDMINHPHAACFTWDNWGNSIRIVIVDESPIKHLHGYDHHDLISVLALGGAVAEAVTHCIAKTLPSDLKALVARIEQQIQDELTLILPPVRPDQADTHLVQAFSRLKQNKKAKFIDLAIQLTRWLSGKVNAVWIGKVPLKSENVDAVFFARKSVPSILDRGLILDAAANEKIYRAALREDLKYFEVNVEQNLLVIQIRDKIFSIRELREDHSLIIRLCALIVILGIRTTSVITHKEFEAAIRAQLPGPISMLHFNGLRGLNSMEKLETLLLIGRMQPPAEAIEPEAMSLWLTEQLECTGKYELQQGVYGGVYGHRDRRIDLLLRDKREGETEHAIGRLRAVRSTETKLLIMATNSPCPLPVDKAVYTDDILLPYKMALVILRDDVFIQSDSFLFTRHPDLFQNQEQAREWVRNLKIDDCILSFNGVFSFPGFNLKQRPSLKSFKFRVEGQPGSLAKGITWRSEAETRELIEALIGKAVIDYRLDELLPEIIPEVITIKSCAKNDSVVFSFIERSFLYVKRPETIPDTFPMTCEKITQVR